MNLGPARRAETPSRDRAVNRRLVLDSQLEVGTEVGFDSGPPCKKLCFTRETRILATRLSVSGIWVLLYRVDPVDMSRVSLGRCGVWRNVERPLAFVKNVGGVFRVGAAASRRRAIALLDVVAQVGGGAATRGELTGSGGAFVRVVAGVGSRARAFWVCLHEP